MTAANTTAPTAAASDTRTVSSSAAAQSGVMSHAAARPQCRQMPQHWVDGPQIATVTTIAIAAIITVAAVNRPKAAICRRWGIQGSRRSR